METNLISSFTSSKLVGPSLQVNSGGKASGDVKLGDKSPNSFMLLSTEGKDLQKGG